MIKPIDTTKKIEALTSTGGPFETTEEWVLGERMSVFRNRETSLIDLLQRTEIHGEKAYLVTYDGRRISFSQHQAMVCQTANLLSNEYGICPGDRVAILAANIPEWVVSFWAISALGAVAVALNGWWTEHELDYAIQHCNPKLLLADKGRCERVTPLRLGCSLVRIEELVEKAGEQPEDSAFPSPENEEDDPCFMLYTSGTTGKPKGAMLSHRSLIGFVQHQVFTGISGRLKNAAGDAGVSQPGFIANSPFFHVSGLCSGILGMAAIGGKLVLRESRFNPEQVLHLIEREEVSTLSALGSMAPRILACPNFDKYDLSSITTVGFGGAPTSEDLLQRIRNAFPNAQIRMGYGLSETAALGAFINGDELLQRPMSTGKASLHHQIEIRNDTDCKVAPGTVGEVHIRSPYLMLEYWGNPSATAGAVKAGRWLATGDMGHLDEEGYLYIDSRARDMILRAAENIYPVEIENRLHGHPQVIEAAVVGVDHPQLGQEVKAVVVIERDARLAATDLSEWVAETLATYKVPSVWEIRHLPLPRNVSGKILKQDL